MNPRCLVVAPEAQTRHRTVQMTLVRDNPGTIANTIGTARVAWSNRSRPRPPETKMTSGASAASSIACLCILSASPPRQRYSISTLLPSVHPSFASAPRNAAIIGCTDGSLSIKPANTPMRRIRSPCCARAVSGHAAAPGFKPSTLRRSGERGNVQARCPLWVKSRHSQCKRACPLYPRKRTFAALPSPPIDGTLLFASVRCNR